MTQSIIAVAGEGRIDVAVLARLIARSGVSVRVYNTRGKSRLDSKLEAYNQAALYSPWAILRDLDQDADCAGILARRLISQPASAMCFRIVVRSIECWLWSDRPRFSDVFHVPLARVPQESENEAAPKQAMLGLLRHSSKAEIRDAMVRRSRRGIQEVGPEYNARFENFVADEWRPQSAAKTAPSLSRAMARIEHLITTTQAKIGVAT
jgi:hypothetical protein